MGILKELLSGVGSALQEKSSLADASGLNMSMMGIPSGEALATAEHKDKEFKEEDRAAARRSENSNTD